MFINSKWEIKDIDTTTYLPEVGLPLNPRIAQIKFRKKAAYLKQKELAPYLLKARTTDFDKATIKPTIFIIVSQILNYAI